MITSVLRVNKLSQYCVASMVVDEKVLWSLCWRYSVDRLKAAK